MTISRGVLVLTSVLVLSGCAGAGTPNSQGEVPTLSQVTSTPTATPTSSAAPAVTSTTPPPLSELTVSPDGLGPIELGRPFTDTSAASPLVWDESYCDSGDQYDFSGWKPSYAEWPFLVAIDGQVVGSPVTYIHIISPELMTDEGLGIGSSTEQVLAEYGSQITNIPDDYYPGYALRGARGQLNFWEDASSPGTIWSLTITEITPDVWAPWEGPCS